MLLFLSESRSVLESRLALAVRLAPRLKSACVAPAIAAAFAMIAIAGLTPRRV
jgi:hypothetical protein